MNGGICATETIRQRIIIGIRIAVALTGSADISIGRPCFPRILRVAEAPSVKVGARFGGGSLTSVTLILTLMVSVRLPSEAVIATV